MAKFIAGLVAGVLLAIGYVRFDVALPPFLRLPDLLRGNVIATATEAELYGDLVDPAVRRRALEIFFANRPADAASLDAEAGHPFLAALHRQRAVREARQLSGSAGAHAKALAQPALRAVLEQKHGTTDSAELARRMLFSALDDYPFLRSWLNRRNAPVTRENLEAVLAEIRKRP